MEISVEKYIKKGENMNIQTNPNTTNFRAKVNLGAIARTLKDPAKTEKAFAMATEEFPKDSLVLKSGSEGGLAFEVYNGIGKVKCFDLSHENVKKLLNSSQKLLEERLVLAFKTLRFGIQRDANTNAYIDDLIKKGVVEDESKHMYGIIEHQAQVTTNLMKEFVAKDEILSKAEFY